MIVGCFHFPVLSSWPRCLVFAFLEVLLHYFILLLVSPFDLFMPIFLIYCLLGCYRLLDNFYVSSSILPSRRYRFDSFCDHDYFRQFSLARLCFLLNFSASFSLGVSSLACQQLRQVSRVYRNCWPG